MLNVDDMAKFVQDDVANHAILVHMNVQVSAMVERAINLLEWDKWSEESLQYCTRV